MLKRITEPQALYTKQGSSHTTMPVMPSSHTSLPPKKSVSKKVVLTVVAVALFLVVGIAGVLTAMRQRQVAGPVAPNAPSSIPLAANDAAICTLEFNVTATPPPTTPPPTTPPPTTPPPTTPPPTVPLVRCVQKNAFLIANNVSTQLDPNSIVAGNSKVGYQLTLSSDTLTTANIVVEDQLAANTTWLSSEVPSADVVDIEQVAGNKLKLTIKPFVGTKIIPYTVTVAQRTQPFTFTNLAKVVSAGAVTGNNCSIALKTAPTGTAVCSEKTAYTVDASGNKTTLATNGSVAPGDMFYYNVAVQATGQTTGAVKMRDTLPAGIEFVEALDPNDPMTTSTDSNGRTVVSTDLGVIGSTATEDEAETRNITFKVKVAANATPGTLKNIAAITTGSSSTASSCEHSVVVPPRGVATCVSKEMYNNSISSGTGTRIAEGSNLSENQEFYYRVKINSAELTKGAVSVTDTLPGGLQLVDDGDFTLDGGRLVASFEPFTGEKTLEMKVKVKAGVQGKVTNKVEVDTANDSTAPSPCESNFNIPSYTCNSNCDSDDQCTRIGSGYKCASTNEGKRCRLTANEGSTSCTQTSTPPPSGVPSIGCNDACSTNADCTNPSHICYETTAGGRCRLDSNVTSESCNNPVAATQPTLPEELPQTGPVEWVNWLKAGLVTLGIGAILLLLL